MAWGGGKWENIPRIVVVRNRSRNIQLLSSIHFSGSVSLSLSLSLFLAHEVS